MKIAIDLEELIELLTKHRAKAPRYVDYGQLEAKVLASTPLPPEPDFIGQPYVISKKKQGVKRRTPNTGWLQEAIHLVNKGTDYKKVGRILTRKGYTTRHGKPISGGAISAAIWRFNHNIDTGYAQKGNK